MKFFFIILVLWLTPVWSAECQDFKFQEDGHMKVSKDGFASKQRVDLNDLLRRASKQKLDDKRNNIIGL